MSKSNQKLIKLFIRIEAKEKERIGRRKMKKEKKKKTCKDYSFDCELVFKRIKHFDYQMNNRFIFAVNNSKNCTFIHIK